MQKIEASLLVILFCVVYKNCLYFQNSISLYAPTLEYDQHHRMRQVGYCESVHGKNTYSPCGTAHEWDLLFCSAVPRDRNSAVIGRFNAYVLQKRACSDSGLFLAQHRGVHPLRLERAISEV